MSDIFSTGFQPMDIEAVRTSTYYFNPKQHTNVLLQSYVDGDQVVVSSLDKVKYLVIEGGHEFKHPNMSVTDYINRKHSFYRSLQFTHFIESEICNFQKTQNPHTRRIGIHFREYIAQFDKQDGRIFSQHSPFEEFVKTIDRFDEKTELFVASNSKDISKRFKQLYGDRVITYEYPTNRIDCGGDHLTTDTMGGRDSKDGMLEAIINMCLLSKCELLIGTTYSSFSDEACFFNLRPKVCVMNNLPSDDFKYHCYGFGPLFDDLYMVLPNSWSILENAKR